MTMTEKEFDEMIDELIELCFEVEAGEYYCDRCDKRISEEEYIEITGEAYE